MPAKLLLILTLIVSLLFRTQAQPLASAVVEQEQGGRCAGMQCALGCCADTACCAMTEQQNTSSAPAPAPLHVPIQFATIGLTPFTLLFVPPAPRHPFVILDEVSTAHALSPLAANCIQLI